MRESGQRVNSCSERGERGDTGPPIEMVATEKSIDSSDESQRLRTQVVDLHVHIDTVDASTKNLI